MSTMGEATLLWKDTEQQFRAIEAILGCVRTWVAFPNTMPESRRFGLGTCWLPEASWQIPRMQQLELRGAQCNSEGIVKC